MSCTENWVAQKLQKTYAYIAQTDDLDKFVDWVTWPYNSNSESPDFVYFSTYFVPSLTPPISRKRRWLYHPRQERYVFHDHSFYYRLTIDDKSKPPQRPQLSLRRIPTTQNGEPPGCKIAMPHIWTRTSYTFFFLFFIISTNSFFCLPQEYRNDTKSSTSGRISIAISARSW